MSGLESRVSSANRIGHRRRDGQPAMAIAARSYISAIGRNWRNALERQLFDHGSAVVVLDNWSESLTRRAAQMPDILVVVAGDNGARFLIAPKFDGNVERKLNRFARRTRKRQSRQSITCWNERRFFSRQILERKRWNLKVAG